MAFTFTCSACEGQLSAERHQIAATAPCPQCQILVRVPDPADRASGSQTLIAEQAPVAFRLDQGESDSEMDMTPMVDVTFLLLIFFMVTAAFAAQKVFETPTPDDEQASQQTQIDQSDAVTVRVDEFNTFHVSCSAWGDEKEAPSPQDLIISLRQARLDAGARELLVMASGEAWHERVIAAMDAGTEVGMDDVKLVTVEDEE